MQHIIIENFGPIKKVDLAVKDYLVFIGPQAGGKSTISKAIYFFKSLKDDLLRLITEIVNNDTDFMDPVNGYEKRIRLKFIGFWGRTKRLKPFSMVYNYGDSKLIFLYSENNYVSVVLSGAFDRELNDIFEQASDYKEGKQSPEDIFAKPDPSDMSRQISFFKKIESLIDELFEDSRVPMYIPAGRSLLSSLSEQLQKNLVNTMNDFLRRSSGEMDESEPYLLNLPLKNFIESVSKFRDSTYSRYLDDIVEDRKNLTSKKINFEYVGKAVKLIEKILKGKYINDHLGERICLPESDDYVRLFLASSGQQEAIWILMRIFAIILSDYPVFLVIEEPEAHLYPEAQKDIIALISLLSNLSDNQVLLTTHSPYILSSVNNLIYAYQVGQTKAEQVEELIDKSIWLSPEKVGAYFVDGGKTEDIIDDELSLIKADAIDSASRIINEEFDCLFDLED